MATYKKLLEQPDPTPMQPPLGYKRAPTLSEQIRQQVLAAKLDSLAELEETEEEADDFEVGDDFTPLSAHENDHVPTLKQLKEHAKHINDEIEKAKLKELRDRIGKEIAEKRGSSPPHPTNDPADDPSSSSRDLS